MGIDGSADELIAIARSMSAVDQATWDAIAPHTSPGDGCDSMFC